MFDIFVYGLLMPGERGFDELNLVERSQRLGHERVNGTLYDLGDYPGLILGGTGLVHGECLRSSDQALLADLDAYELYDANNLEASEFLRTRIALLGSGQLVWIYVYLRPLGACSVIASGDWRAR